MTDKFYLKPNGKIACNASGIPMVMSQSEWEDCCCADGACLRRGYNYAGTTPTWLVDEFVNPSDHIPLEDYSVDERAAYIRYADLFDKLCWRFENYPGSETKTATFTLYELDKSGREWGSAPPLAADWGDQVWSSSGTAEEDWCIDISGISTTWLVMKMTSFVEDGDPSEKTGYIAYALTDDCANCGALLS